MDKMLYVAMSGAKETSLAQQVNAHNLANISTTGFRADLESMLAQPIYGPGHPDRAYALSTDMKTFDFSPGPVEQTGRRLDVAIRGDGWMSIQAPDGTEAMTRRGDLHVTVDGMLTTGNGDLVLGVDGPILVPPYESLEIGQDGTISIRPVGQPANTLAVINRINLFNPDADQLEKGNDGRVRYKGDDLRPDAQVQLVSGALERSNVNGVSAMVRMIDLQRHFEMQVKMMETADENGRGTLDLMRTG